MEYTHLLVRYGEIFLKGKNQHFFRQKLVENIFRIAGSHKLQYFRGRIVLDYFESHRELKRVFGLVSYSPAVCVEKNIENIKKELLSLLLASGEGKTFRVATKRSDKTFALSSLEVNAEVSEFIMSRTSRKLNLKDADITLNVEINVEGAFVFTGIISCFGGLPVGTGGKVLVLIEDDASLLAGLLFLRRGCSIVPLMFRKEKDISLLQHFSPEKLKLKYIKSMAEIRQAAKEYKTNVLVVGQCLSTIKEFENGPGLVILKPLIGYNPELIKSELARFT